MEALSLAQLQTVVLTETDQRHLSSLCSPHQVGTGPGSGIAGVFIGDVCPKDWALSRTSKATIERCKTNLAGYGLDASTESLIRERLEVLWTRIADAPKSSKWKLRSRVGDRMRWYDEPEENTN